MQHLQEQVNKIQEQIIHEQKKEQVRELLQEGKNIGIEKTKKQRRSWYLMDDGIEYPHFALARHKLTRKIDFFWRIPRDQREYLVELTSI